MDELGLVQRGPKEPLPACPSAASLALFMGTHWRLGSESPIFLLDANVLEGVIECYAHIYASLEGAYEFGDTSPWYLSFALSACNGLHASHPDSFNVHETLNLASPGRARRRPCGRIQHLRCYSPNAAPRHREADRREGAKGRVAGEHTTISAGDRGVSLGLDESVVAERLRAVRLQIALAQVAVEQSD